MRTSLVLVACLCLAVPASAGQICLVESPNGNNGTVDCDPSNPQLHVNAVTGYSTDGTPCEVGFCAPIESGGRGMFDYGWSISSSDQDPYQNSGPLPIGVVFLNLWLNCTLVDGMAAAEISVASDPDLLFLAFTTLNGVLNAGSGPDLLLAVGGCPLAPLLAGQILVLYTGPVSVETQTWSGIKSMYR